MYLHDYNNLGASYKKALRFIRHLLFSLENVMVNILVVFVMFLGLTNVSFGHTLAHSSYCEGDEAYVELLDNWHGGVNLSESINVNEYSDSEDLYNIEVGLHSILDAATRCNDLEMLVEILDKLWVISNFRDSNVHLPFDSSVITWPSTSGSSTAANTLDAAQFLALAADTVHALVSAPNYATAVDPFSKTEALLLANVVRQHVWAWVFGSPSDDAFRFEGYPYCPALDSDLPGAKNLNTYLTFQPVLRPIFYDYDSAAGVFVKGLYGLTDSLWCYSIKDVHLWIVASATNLVGIYDLLGEGTAFGMDEADRDSLATFVNSVALPEIRTRFKTTTVQTFSGASANGTVFDPGIWKGHPDYPESDSYAQYLPQDVVPKNNFLVGDVSGDGLDDIVVNVPSSASVRGGFRLLCNTGKGDINDRHMRYRPCHAVSINSSAGWVGLGDFDGDGDKEIYQYGSVSGSGFRVLDYTKINSSSSIVKPDEELKNVFSQLPSWGDVQTIGDYDEDGIDDIFQYRATKWTITVNGSPVARNWRVLCPKPGTSNPLPVCGSFDSGEISSGGVGAGISLSGGRETSFAADYDGDGKADLWVVNANGIYIWRSNSGQQSFRGAIFLPVGFGVGSGHFQVGNHNSDNRADLFQWVKSDSSGNGYYRVLCATGAGTTSSPWGLTTSCADSETASNGSYFRVGRIGSSSKDGIIRALGSNRLDGFYWSSSSSNASHVLDFESAWNDDQAEDIGHLSRLIFFLKTIYRNRSFTSVSWPSSSVQGTKTLIANQYAYQMFNKGICDILAGQTCAPAVRNFWNGSNGWYRTNYNNTTSTGIGPYDFTSNAGKYVIGRYGLLAEVREDVRDITSMFRILSRQFDGNESVVPSANLEYWRNYWHLFGEQDSWINDGSEVRLLSSAAGRKKGYVKYLLPALVNVYSR